MLSFSTGHGGRLVDRYRALIRQYGRNKRLAAMDFESVAESRRAFERHVRRPLERARVLDLGCGQRFPAALLFHSWRAEATGIDTDVVDPAFSPASFVRMIRANGFERFVKSLARHLVFDPEYYRELRRLAGRELRFKSLDLRLMDARSLAFPDGHFDLVHSNAVFEHLSDVPRVLEEVARVLKPDGIASIGVHLFASLSGGHHLEWAFPEDAPSRRVPPWDHLREAKFGSHAYLNKWSERQFVDAFRARFAIVEHASRNEGESYLTRDIERELKDYTREELLKREIRVVLRKTTPPPSSRTPRGAS